jgi:hypothetical protein
MSDPSNLLPEGTYRAQPASWWWDESTNGNYYLHLVFPVDHEGHSHEVNARLFFTDAAADRAIESLRYLGWTDDDLSRITENAGFTPALVSIVVEHETNDKGHTFARVKWINRLGGGSGPRNAPPAASLYAFANNLRGKVAAVTQGLQGNGKLPQTKGQGQASGQPQTQTQTQAPKALPGVLASFASSLARAKTTRDVANATLDVRTLAQSTGAWADAWKAAVTRARAIQPDVQFKALFGEIENQRAQDALSDEAPISEGRPEDDIPF